MADIPRKRRRTASPIPSQSTDPERCIICQRDEPNLNTSGTENGRLAVIHAAGIRGDCVLERLNHVDQAKFVYHVNNDCYKRYTHKRNLERLQLAATSDAGAQQSTSSSGQMRRRSSTAARDPASRAENVDIFSKPCFICGHAKHNNVYKKWRISEEGRAKSFLRAALSLQDEVYTRTSDLQDADAVFGADLYCHNDCIRKYILKGERQSSKSALPSIGQKKLDIFADVMKNIEPGLNSGRCYNLSYVSDSCNEVVQSGDQNVTAFRNRDVKLYLLNMYGNDVSFFTPQSAKAPTIFFKNSAVDSMPQHSDREMTSDILKQCGLLLRKCFLKEDFELNDKFCDANELEKAYRDIAIPDEVAEVFSTLFDFDVKCNYNDPDNSQHKNLDDCDISDGKMRKILSVYQVMFYIVNNGRKRTPLHMLNSEAIYNACRSKTLISSLNRFGLATSYDEVLRYHCDMASYITESNRGQVPLPSQFDRSRFTIGAFDNFDHEENTLSGIGGSHDTVSILMQDKPAGTLGNSKPNRSQTQVTHRERQFKQELSCQVLKNYIKPAKKPSLPTVYEVPEDLYEADECRRNVTMMKDAAWMLGRMNMSDMKEGIRETSQEQQMPSWSAFNSLVTHEDVPQKIIGFLPVLPYPVTEYATVYTALKNFQDILSQLDQSHLPITCDEGVYHIAREIIMHNPDEFSNLVLCLGSFHLIKVVMGAIGKYIDGSGAETILAESKAFGRNVVRSVLDGTHYTRSLKGLMLLSECLERLQWAEFFRINGVEPYMNELSLIQLMKSSVSEKKQEESRAHLEAFISISSKLIDDFNAFRSDRCEVSETFAFWDQFVKMVSILRNLVRADREGNWDLHLQSLQATLPLFAGCDRINYLRWASVYLEDMRKLPQDAPNVFENFKAGKFVVKRTGGQFTSVGADMCLEQTINRSQKSAGGIIGSTKRKLFVAQWEIIHHEMLAVVNLQYKISGVVTPSRELLVNHEFNLPATRSSEALVDEIIRYVKEHDNPVRSSAQKSKDDVQTLHNIISQEVMPQEIRNDLLQFDATCKTLYETFRTERFVTRQRSISDTIHRRNLKTFKSNTAAKHTRQTKAKENKKQLAETQKIFDIARVRGYDLQDLLTYDLIDINYLFDSEGLMVKPNKSDLCHELEKLLDAKDYLQPPAWTPVNTAAIVDVMGYLRRMRTVNLNTFGDLCTNFLGYVHGLCKNANRIDFVFDTYIEGSVKDSERARRCNSSPIDLNDMSPRTPLPVNMESFWASPMNKAKLQGLIREHILENPMQTADIVVSAFGLSETKPCRGVFNDISIQLPELNHRIEEADVRMIPHALHAVKGGASRTILLSNDTDVLVLGLHYWNLLRGYGLKELWIRAGVGNATRHIPLHTLAEKMDPEIRKVILPLHHLTGCDASSKFGTKSSGLKAKPAQYLCEFGKDPTNIDFAAVEEYLVNVFKSGTPCKSMDQLRHHLYHHSKKTILDLPPTSRSVKGHILRAFYGTYLQLHCLDNAELNPCEFGFYQDYCALLPERMQLLLPNDFPLPCKCSACATQRCPCRQNQITCCPYCSCQANNTGCRNPVS